MESTEIMGLAETVSLYSSYIQMFGVLISAIISAYALIKVNKSNISDKISRSQWAFEMYINFVGTYLVSEHNIEDYKKYKGFYFMFYAYADNQIKEYLIYIDKLIKKGKYHKAEKKILKLINLYYHKYKMKKYSSKSIICINEQKKKLDMFFKSELNRNDFEL